MMNENLTRLRKEHGYSQEQLAEKLNVSRQAVSKWETGEALPDTENLIQLAKIFNVSLDELVGLNKENKSESKEKSDSRNDSEAPAGHRKTSRKSEVIVFFTMISSVLVFFLLGHFYHMWYISWAAFMLIPIVSTLTEAIEKKDPKLFAFPVVCAMVYVIMGFMRGMWHPGWIIFLAVPVYYFIAESICGKK